MPRSLSFPETMIGDVTFCGSTTAATALRAYRFTMRVQWYIPDLDVFFDDPRHTVTVTGTVECEALGGKLPVSSGTVELFAEDAGRTVMNYRLHFPAANGEQLELRGSKQVVHDRPKDLWPDTTTLPVEVVRAATREPLVAGTVHLTAPRVLHAIAGMRASRGLPWRERVGTIVAFDRFFLAELASVYLAAVRRSPGRPVLAGGRAE